MINKCPGQGSRNLSIGFLACPLCGYNIEIFSDEIKAKCPGCKAVSYRQAMPSCLDWCRAARQCIGEEKFDKINAQ